jgi:flavin reductase (DIM6/NTAB) family NADH-FMN oxidoreductase RutF
VADSPVAFECKVTQIVRLQSLDGAPIDTWLTLGEVVAVHIAQRLLKDGVYDTGGSQTVLRGGGPADYFEIGAEQRFRMRRPQ